MSGFDAELNSGLMGGRVAKWMSWVFLAATIVIHLVMVTSLGTGFLHPFFHDTRYMPEPGLDFFAFYQAGTNVLNGLDAFAYPDPLTVPYMFPYRYLPYFAHTFGAVLNLAPPMLSYWSWVAVLIVCVWLAALRTWSVSKSMGKEAWEGRVAMGMWFVFSPIFIELHLGQVTLMAGILVFFALTTPSIVKGKKGNWSLTAFWTGGSLMKLIPFFIAPVLIGAGKARAVVVGLIIFVIGIVAVPAGLEGLLYFLSLNSGQMFYVKTPYIGNHSLKMLLYYLLGEPGSDFLIITGLLLGSFLVVSMAATLYSRDVWVTSGLFSLLYFIIMFDVWEHHYNFLLPFLVLAWLRGSPGSKSRWVPLLLTLIMSVPMLQIAEFLSGIDPGTHPISMDTLWLILYHSSMALPAVIFYGWLLVMAFRSPRSEGFVNSAQEAYMIGWANLVNGDSPTIEKGLVVQNDYVDNERLNSYPR